MLEKLDNVTLKTNDYDKNYTGLGLYESDLRLELKHSIDYFLTRKTAMLWKPETLFWDIEVYTGKATEFPDARQAKYPINAISFRSARDSIVDEFLLRLPEMDKKEIVVPENTRLRIFDSEKELLRAFAKYVRTNNFNVCAGWNTENFDMPYLLNRMNKNGISYTELSPIGEVSIDMVNMDRTSIFGLYFIDQLKLYKKLNYSVEPSYKLSAITQKHLGHTKVAYEGTLNELYENDINTFIRYSSVDTQLLYELEEKVQHITTRLEMIRLCSSTWKAAEKTMGLLDPMSISYAKRNGLVC
jgi:DNA polymerase elongation subunit (family B)